MYMNSPVLACNSGGPKESVLDQKTGFLLDSQPEHWAEKMQILFNDQSKRKSIGEYAHNYVKHKFSFESFADASQLHITIASGKRKLDVKKE